MKLFGVSSAVLFFLILFYAVGAEVHFLGVEGCTDGITTHEAAGDVFDKLRATFPGHCVKALAHVHLAAGAVGVAHNDDTTLRLGNALPL